MRRNRKVPGESVYTDVTEATETPKTYESVTPPATGISEEENLASDGDIHKVYLTFEDGPSDHTGEILDILAQYDVKATFLWSGKRMKNPRHCIRESQMRDIRSACILIPTNTARFISRMRHLKKILNAYVMNCIRSRGVNSIYYRFPGGSSNQISNVPMSDFIHYLNEQGVIYYDWNVSAGDAASNAYSSEEIVANVMDDVVKYKTSVVLLHDASDKSATVEALAPLIEALNEMGAEILPIDEDTSVIQYVKADSID